MTKAYLENYSMWIFFSKENKTRLYMKNSFVDSLHIVYVEILSVDQSLLYNFT